MRPARVVGRRLAAVVALAAAAVALVAAPASAAAATPICSAVLFEPVDGNGAYMVEQPESAPGAIFCDSTEAELDFDLAAAPEHGTLSALTADQLGGASFTYTPDPGYEGADSFTLSAREAGGDPVEVEVRVAVWPEGDDPPVCNAQLMAEAEGGAYRVTTGTAVAGSIDCYDDEGAELSFAVQTAPAHGTLSAIEREGDATGSYTYTPDPGYEGADSFALVAADGSQDSEPAVIEVAVAAPVDEPPHCVGTLATTSDASGIYEVEQGETVHGAVTCVDDDDAPLAFAVGTSPGHGSLAPLAPAGEGGDSADLTYTPAPDHLGFDSFQILVSDGVNPATAVTLQLRVVPERDDPPVCTAELLVPAAGGAYRVKEGTTVAGKLDCEDDGGESLTYAVASGPQHGSVGAIDAEGRFSYTAPSAYVGPDRLSLVADDGTQDSRPVVLEIAVTEAVDEPPECQVTLGTGADEAGAYLVDRDTAVEGRVVCADDIDPDPALTVAAAPLHGSLSALTPDGAGAATFTYTPAARYLGADTFGFAGDDGATDPTTVTVTVEVVEPGPDRPHCSARLNTPVGTGGYEVEEGETVTGTLACFDAGGKNLTFAVARAPGHGEVQGLEAVDGGAVFTYTADEGWRDADDFGLVASNGEASSEVVDFDLTVVEAVDDPPVCAVALFSERQSSGVYPANAGEDNPGVIYCEDDEGEHLTFAVVNPPGHGTIVNLEPDEAEGESALFDYRAEPGHLGPDVATLSARDPAGGEDVVTLDLEVGPGADTAPTCAATLDAPFAAGAYTVAAGTAANGQITCDDAESDPLTFSVVEQPSRGTLGPLTGAGESRAFTYTAAADPGPDHFTVKANDGTRDSQPVTIALLVQGSEAANPGGGGATSPGGGGASPGTPAPPSTPTGSSPSTPSPARPHGHRRGHRKKHRRRPKKCRKGFKRKKVHGKARCVRTRHRHRHRHRRRKHPSTRRSPGSR